LKVRTLLRPEADAGQPWHWTLNPYEGCEFACTFCHARLDRDDFDGWRYFERRIGVKTNALETFLKEARSDDFQGRPVVIGSTTEPYQQIEEQARITRGLLEGMAKLEGLDLRINTRSSLIARDTDVLREVARNNHVTIAVSLASLDERINRVMEPRAPSALRRLAALEALARAGLNVGLHVSPVFVGLDEEELGLASLLTRAANAGARFAGAKLLTFGPGQRENFLAHVTTAYPALSAKFRRIVGVKPPSAEDQARLLGDFDGLCARLGLATLEQATSPRAPARREGPAQLTLFT
jgi:DNA repair photolyase